MKYNWMQISAFLLSICLVLSFVYWFVTRDTSKPTVVEVYNTEYGAVTHIESCNVGKHSYRCRVRTATHQWDSLEIDELPDSQLIVGDKLMTQIVTYSNGETKQWFCKNNTCVFERMVN